MTRWVKSWHVISSPCCAQWQHWAGFSIGSACQGLSLDRAWGWAPVQHLGTSLKGWHMTSQPRKAARPSPKENTDPGSAPSVLLRLQTVSPEQFWQSEIWHRRSITWFNPRLNVGAAPLRWLLASILPPKFLIWDEWRQKRPWDNKIALSAADSGEVEPQEAFPRPTQVKNAKLCTAWERMFWLCSPRSCGGEVWMWFDGSKWVKNGFVLSLLEWEQVSNKFFQAAGSF